MKLNSLQWIWAPDPAARSRPPLVRYGVPALSVALALALFLVVHLDGFPLILAAVAFAAWFGGLRPGLLATVSSLFIIISAYLFSRGAKDLRPVDVEQMILFTLLSFLIGSLSEALQAAKRRAEAFALDWRKSEERYKRIVETANEGIWTIDAEGKTDYVNPKMAEMLGHAVDDMLGRPLFDFMDEHVAHRAALGLEERKHGVREQLETRFRRNDGSELRSIVSTSPILDNRGEYLGSLGMVMDITERKHMEIELKKERDFTAAVLETAGCLVVVLDRRGGIVRFNSTCQQTTGYSFDEVKGKLFWELLAVPEELDDVRLNFQQVLAGELPNKRENRCRTRSGESRLIAWSNTALVDASGAVEYVIKTGIDITERRQAEEALRHSEERFALAVRGSSDGLWDWNIVTDETYISPRFKELIGYNDNDATEHISITFEHRLHAEDRDRVLQALRDHLEHQVPYDVEYRLRTREGGYRWYHSRGQAIWDEMGRATRMAGSFRDITDRKRAEEALRLTQFSVDHSADAVFWLGPDGRILYANESACRSLAFSREDLLRMRVQEIEPEGSAESWAERWETIKKHGSVTVESVHRARDGREFPVEITSSYLDFRSQEYICSFVRDITERKRAEEALQRAHDDLERRVQERTAELALANDVLRAEIAEREQAEEALRSSHNLLAAFLEGMTEAMYVKDLHGRYLTINQAGARFLGRSVGEVVGKSDAELLSPETARGTIDHDRRVLASGQTQTYEWEGTAAGVTRMFLDTKGVYRDGRGNIIGLIGISRDITERKRAEEGLRRAHDELELRVRERTTELAQANEALTAEITERRRAEEELRDSEERYRLLFESNPQPMWVYDSETLALLAVNEAAIRHYGYSRDEFLRMSIVDLQPPEEAASLYLRMAESRALNLHNGRGWRHRKKDGTIIDVELTSSALTFSGRPARVALANDVTVRNRAEDALRRRNRELVAINTVAAVINSSLRLPGVLATLKGLLAETLGIAGGGIFLYDEGDRRLYLQTGWGLPLELLAEIDKFLNSEPNKKQAFWKGRSIFKPDFSAVSPMVPVGVGGERLEWQNCLCVPFSAKGEVQGVLLLFNRSPAEFGEEQVDFYAVLGQQVGVAIQNARLFEQVRASRRRLKDLSFRLVEVQEAERRAVARELHDEIGQVLTGLKLSLEMAARLPAEKRGASLEEPQVLVNRLLGQVRAMSLDLRPTMLDDLGLKPALLWHFQQYTAQTGIRVAFEHAGLDRRFPPEVETAAYRIIQEALTNVARHAGVQEVTTRIWANQDTLGLQVKDQGVGFDSSRAAAARTSTGLSSMHERAFLLRGRLTIEAAVGAGTTLMAELPLNGLARKTRKVRAS